MFKHYWNKNNTKTAKYKKIEHCIKTFLGGLKTNFFDDLS